MDQVQVVKIDMALLSAVDARDSLTFNNLQTNDVAVQSANNNKTSIVIPGVPQEAVLILFGPDN